MPNSFLQITDLPAGAADDKGWLPVKNVSESMAVEIGKFDKGKARALNYSEHNDMEVKKPFDRASLFLKLACSSGQLLKGVNLAFSRGDEKEFYLKIELKNVYVSDLAIDLADGDEAEETVKFNYESIVWKFRPKLKTGKLGDWIQAGWNRQDRQPATGA